MGLDKISSHDHRFRPRTEVDFFAFLEDGDEDNHSGTRNPPLKRPFFCSFHGHVLGNRLEDDDVVLSNPNRLPNEVTHDSFLPPPNPNPKLPAHPLPSASLRNASTIRSNCRSRLSSSIFRVRSHHRRCSVGSRHQTTMSPLRRQSSCQAVFQVRQHSA